MNPRFTAKPRAMALSASAAAWPPLLLVAAVSLGACGRAELRRSAGRRWSGRSAQLVEPVTAGLSNGEALIRSNMAQGLVRLDSGGAGRTGLAERWNVSDDGLSYIFRLQTGEWPDGRKIKAHDVARICRA